MKQGHTRRSDVYAAKVDGKHRALFLESGEIPPISQAYARISSTAADTLELSI